MPPRVAAVTMSYNEAAYLPVWARHYARQVGADHCYVVDHGSTEPIRLPPGVNVLRIPRSAHDDARRAAFVSQLAASLLHYYDWVLHSDVDELLVADPALAPNIPAFCDTLAEPTLFAAGLDIQHVPAIEPGLDPDKPIGAQRGWARFTSAMCKPVLTRQPVRWAPGFHSCDQPPVFGPLYLLHLHWADQAIGLQRLGKTRAMPWEDLAFGAHARISDANWQALFEGMAGLPRQESVAVAWDEPPLSDWLHHVQVTTKRTGDGVFAIPHGENAGELWPVANRLRSRLG